MRARLSRKKAPIAPNGAASMCFRGLESKPTSVNN
jgi:hypothetical protein